MKSLLKFLKWSALTIVLLIIGGVVYVFARQSHVYEAPYPDLHASTDSAVIARGEYLVYGPAHCSGCHSPVENWERLEAGEHLPLEGGFQFPLELGVLYTPNLTPDEETGIGKYTDQEIARALTYGVGRDGRALLDIMPFHNLSEEDKIAVISYLRSQPAVKRQIPATEWNFMGKVVKALVIRPVGPNGEVPKSVAADTTAAYGVYLANSVANCRGCHTNRDLKTGAYVGEYYAGGFALPSARKPGVACVSPNLTPDATTGHVVNWTREKFIERMKQGRIIPASDMPWTEFKGFSDNDLKAIWAYLQTLKPVQNKIDQTVVELKP